MQRKHIDWVQNEKLKEEEDEIKYEESQEETVNEESKADENEDLKVFDEGKIQSMENTISELQNSNNRLSDENNKLQNEIEALKDKLVRISAEYENYRKRTVKEKEGIYGDACEDVLKNMFPVFDNLERAYSVEGNVEDIKKGIDMTIRQFKTGLEKILVEEISTEEGFDPNYHNAVMHVDDPALGKNQVVEVFQKGYKRGEKVLRHSMVKVAN